VDHHRPGISASNRWRGSPSRSSSSLARCAEALALIAVGLQSVLFFLYYACSWVPYGFDFAIGDLVGLAGGALVLGGGIALWRGQSRARAAQPAASAVGGGAAVAG
jgi:hypothetical protein